MSKRVAIYVRVSTLDQSTELQREELLAYCKRQGWCVENIYADEGISGATSKRPGLNALLQAVQRRRVDAVIVWKLDRLFRSLSHLVNTLQLWQELGVEFLSLSDNINLATAQGQLMMHMLGAFAEFERALIAERVRAGVAHAKSKGVSFGPPRTVDTKRVQELRARGMTTRAIAEELQCGKSSVARILAASAPPTHQVE